MLKLGMTISDLCFKCELAFFTLLTNCFCWCRWGSTYTMINDVLKTEKVCRDAARHGNADLKLPDADWKALHEINDTLQPAFIATKQLQAKDITLPDVRKFLCTALTRTANLGTVKIESRSIKMNCSIKFFKNNYSFHFCWTGTPFSQELVFAFQTRYDKITDSRAMKNALFCDPRYIFELSVEERRQTKIRLSDLHDRIESNIYFIRMYSLQALIANILLSHYPSVTERKLRERNGGK